MKSLGVGYADLCLVQICPLAEGVLLYIQCQNVIYNLGVNHVEAVFLAYHS